jgi:hypothetical protein
VSALRIGLVLAIAVAAAVFANVVLLGVATGSGEQVGRLNPRPGPAAIRPPASPTPPRTTVTPPQRGGEHRDRHEDD